MDNTDHPVRYKRWDDVPEGLLSKTALREKGLKPGPNVRGTIYMKRRNLWVELYNENEAIPRKPATPLQLEALGKARLAQEAARTCSGCGQLYSFNLKGSICDYCNHELWLDDISLKAKNRFIYWMEHMDEFAVLDVETTGMEDDAEIVEIAVVGLDERILYHSLIRPERPIPLQATAIHGITNEMVAHAPSWHEVWPRVRSELSFRKALIFNEAFDMRMIYSSCRRNRLPAGQLLSECVMETYAQYSRSYSSYHKNFTWISLENAAMTEGTSTNLTHRSIEDSLLTVRLIRRIAVTGD